MNRMFRSGRYANVTATMALIVALGGTSYAAVALPKNSVGSNQIKKNAVKSSEIKKNAVKSSEIKAKAVGKSELKTNAVTSKRVLDNTLTGGDITESSLGTVPSASVAGLAVNVQGLTKISFRAAAGTPSKVIYNSGGLVLKAACDAAGNLAFTMETAVNNAIVFADSHDHDGSPDADGDPQQPDFDPGDVVDLIGSLHGADPQGVEINYSSPGGGELFVKTQNWEDTGSGAVCQIGGIAILQ